VLCDACGDAGFLFIMFFNFSGMGVVCNRGFSLSFVIFNVLVAVWGDSISLE
jgi:hypothetical protein